MKKLIVLTFAVIISTTSCYGWGWKKDSKTNPPAVYDESQAKGYVGTLPDVSKGFTTSEPSTSKPLYEQSKQFNSANEIKPVPRDNPAFVNIILKSDKTSPYINDINEIIPMLENILTCIEDKLDVQKFNAKVYFFNKNIEYLRDKYQNKPESTYISFTKLLELNTHTKSVATLRSEAEKYRPYLAYTGAGYLYNDNVINQQLDYLRQEIEDTIVVLKEAE